MNLTQHTRLARHYRTRYDVICKNTVHIDDRRAMFRKWRDHEDAATRLVKQNGQDATVRGLMSLGIVSA